MSIGGLVQGAGRKKIPDRANRSQGLSLEISGFEITWLLGQRLGEQARQPSFRRLVLRGQRLQQLEQRQPEQQRGSMALQRPCGRGERSGDGMASAQRSCSRA